MLDIHKETISGTKTNRHARNQVMALAQACKIDAVLVAELSRWGRSTQDLLETLNQLAGWSVSVVAMSGRGLVLRPSKAVGVDRLFQLPPRRLHPCGLLQLALMHRRPRHHLQRTIRAVGVRVERVCERHTVRGQGVFIVQIIEPCALKGGSPRTDAGDHNSIILSSN
ncbi:MAG: recombinase family protein [Pikeienuella sp.]